MAEKSSKQGLDHPALHHLLVTPGIVQDLMEGLSEDQAFEKAGDSDFSLAEYLEYLSHIEAHYFRATLDLMIGAGASDGAAGVEARKAEVPAMQPYGREALHASGVYSDREPEESLAHWEVRRDDNMELLESLTQSDLSRQAVHPVFGIITLDALLRAWAAHDLDAIQKIAGYARRFLYAE